MANNTANKARPTFKITCFTRTPLVENAGVYSTAQKTRAAVTNSFACWGLGKKPNAINFRSRVFA
jgi:hypothetical protein